MYNQAVFLARHKNPNITFKELAENEIDAIQVTLKERHKPFKMGKITIHARVHEKMK